MIFVYIGENNKFQKQIRYTFKTIFNILGIEFEFIESLNKVLQEDIIINYGQKIYSKKNFINIKSGKLFTNKYLSLQSMPDIPLRRYNEMPILYQEDNKEIYVKFQKEYITTNIDIIQSIFFMITCYEEAIFFQNIKKDKCGRFPPSQSLAVREKFFNIPIVNEYIEWLFKWIKYLNCNYNKKSLWGDYEFTACLTHDVDRPLKYTYPLSKDIKRLKHTNIHVARDIVLHTLKNIDYKYDSFNTFDYIRKVEKKYNFNSSFYFMTGGETNYDNNYKLYDPMIVDLIKKLEFDNCEVGYHYSFNASENYDLRKYEKELLDKQVKNKSYGGRNHYLRFRAPQSWVIGEKTGLLYDTTLGYNNIIGFRCGLCTPYKVFDIFENKELDIWEIPLIIMDSALKNGKDITFSINDITKQITKYIDIVKKYNGTFTFLWHNSSFNEPRWKGSKRVYEYVLKYLYDNRVLALNGREIIEKIRSKENE